GSSSSRVCRHWRGKRRITLRPRWIIQSLPPRFRSPFQRVLYFDSTQTHSAGQFFPYVIEKDAYGQKIVPENLGNIDPDPWFTYPPRLPADLIRAARKNRVIRDGWVSAFFHPYLDLAYLRELVSGIKALGYTYVPLTDSAPLITNQPHGQTNALGSTVRLQTTAVGTIPLRFQWRFNGTALSGATNAVLILTNAQTSQSGNYSVLVSNSLGTAISSNATARILARPIISHAVLGATGFTLSFASERGQTYCVEYKSSFAGPVWNLLTTLSGNGSVLNVSDPSRESSRFYRVRVQ